MIRQITPAAAPKECRLRRNDAEQTNCRKQTMNPLSKDCLPQLSFFKMMPELQKDPRNSDSAIFRKRAKEVERKNYKMPWNWRQPEDLYQPPAWTLMSAVNKRWSLYCLDSQTKNSLPADLLIIIPYEIDVRHINPCRQFRAEAPSRNYRLKSIKHPDFSVSLRFS